MTACLRALATICVLATPGLALAEGGPLVVGGELRDGDERCHMLCDRYGLVWQAGGRARVRLVTQGFRAYLREGATVSGSVGAVSEIAIVAAPGQPVFVEVNAYDQNDRGLYRIEVDPPPTSYLLPRSAPPAPSAAPSPPRVELLAAGPGPALPAPAEAEPDQRALVAELARGYRPLSGLMVGRLDAVPALRFPARSGRCYRAALVLARGARRAPANVVWMRLTSPGGSSASMETERSTPQVIALDSDLCPSADGTLEIAFYDRRDGATLTSPGRGPFTLQVFERTGRAR